MDVKAKCIFDTGGNGRGCDALKEKYCSKGVCSFYKSKREYVINEDGYVEKRSDYNGNTSVANR